VDFGGEEENGMLGFKRSEHSTIRLICFANIIDLDRQSDEAITAN
jgi:hypothetical protein